jgi:hypothetical protein
VGRPHARFHLLQARRSEIPFRVDKRKQPGVPSSRIFLEPPNDLPANALPAKRARGSVE